MVGVPELQIEGFDGEDLRFRRHKKPVDERHVGDARLIRAMEGADRRDARIISQTPTLRRQVLGQIAQPELEPFLRRMGKIR